MQLSRMPCSVPSHVASTRSHCIEADVLRCALHASSIAVTPRIDLLSRPFALHLAEHVNRLSHDFPDPAADVSARIVSPTAALQCLHLTGSTL